MAPEVAGETHDHPMPVYQHRMIVGWVDGEHGAWRKGTGGLSHLAPFARATDFIPLRVRPKAACQTNKARKKEPKNNREAKENMPLHDEPFPKAEHHDEVGPEKELCIIPFPRSKFDEGTGDKDRCRREK